MQAVQGAPTSSTAPTRQRPLSMPHPMLSAPAIAPEHIVELHGKRFITFAGLLALAHTRAA